MQTVKGMIFLDKENNVFDKTASSEVYSGMERTVNSQGKGPCTGGKQEVEKIPACDP